MKILGGILAGVGCVLLMWWWHHYYVGACRADGHQLDWCEAQFWHQL